MAESVKYHSLHCRDVSVDQEAGTVYRNDHEFAYGYYGRIAQFIGPKPLSESCDSFSIEITNSGLSGEIGIGLCHKRYSPGRLPGWDRDSIGYHADNGGVYHEIGHVQPHRKFGPVYQGEVMECSMDFYDRTVTFRRNGNLVFTSQPLQIPPDGFYPIIGLRSPGEVVRLLELEPWTPDTNCYDPKAVAQLKNVVFHSLYCRETRTSHTTGIVRYHNMSRNDPVGQFVSMCPLSPECNKFSIEIASLGQRSCISVGVCHRCYPSNCQPGWLPNSIAYRADNGGIYHGSDEPCSKGPRGRAGDTLSCEFDFSTKTFIFRRNGITIFKSPPVTIPPGGFHAAVGFHSAGEAVCLLEREPWRLATSESESVRLCETEPVKTEVILSSTESTLPADNRTTPKCCICMDKGVARFLIPCGHTFCTECVEKWTARHSTCPACREPCSDVQMLYF